LRICRDDGITFVRKFISNPERLSAEVAKMKRLQSLSGRLFDVPTIWQCASTYYELEYLRGITLEERLQVCPISEVEKWAKRCADIVRQLRCEPSVLSVSESSFLLRYLERVAERYPRYGKLLERIDSLDTSPSFSHGDLTLDNILVTQDDEVFLIDPSCHEFDTYQWDIAKLMQSCYCDWWEMRGARENRSRRLAIFCRFLLSEFLFDADLQTTALYLAVVLLRIMRYASNAGQRQSLESRAFVMLDQYLGVRLPFTMEESRWI